MTKLESAASVCQKSTTALRHAHKAETKTRVYNHSLTRANKAHKHNLHKSNDCSLIVSLMQRLDTVGLFAAAGLCGFVAAERVLAADRLVPGVGVRHAIADINFNVVHAT